MLAFYLSLIDDPSDKYRFEEIYRTYKNQMLYFAFGILKNSYDAEDAVHTAFFNIAKNIKRLNSLNYNEAKNYCFKAVKNAALNMLNKKSKIKTFVSLDENENEAYYDNLLDEVCAAESAEKIREAISKLDTVYKDVLTMYFLYDMRASEIAQLYNRSTATVRKQILRGKQKLCDLLKEGLKNDCD